MSILKDAQRRMKTPKHIKQHTVSAAVKKVKNSLSGSNSKKTPTKSKTPPKSKTPGPLNRVTKNKARMDYPVYKKSSPEAGSFRSAYRMARKAKAAGKSVKGGGNAFSYNAKTNVFTWKGKKYKAESAGEKTKREAAAKARKNRTTQSPVKRSKVSYSAASKTDKRRTRGPAAHARKTTKRYGGGQGGF